MATISLEQFKDLSLEDKLIYWSQLSDDYDLFTDALVQDIVARYPFIEEYDKAKKELILIFLLALKPKDRELYRLSEERVGKSAITEEDKELVKARTSILAKITKKHAILGRKCYGEKEWNAYKDLNKKVIYSVFFCSI
jgi:hypothetical protein